MHPFRFYINKEMHIRMRVVFQFISLMYFYLGHFESSLVLRFAIDTVYSHVSSIIFNQMYIWLIQLSFHHSRHPVFHRDEEDHSAAALNV